MIAGTEATRHEGTKGAQDWQPEILAFCCNYCAYAAADLAGSKRMQYASNVRIIHTPCTGKVEMEHLLAAFEKGVDGILIAGCLEGGCHFQDGILRARMRTDRMRLLLDEIGVGGPRLLMANLSAAMAPTFVERIQEIVAVVRALGPNPLKKGSGVGVQGSAGTVDLNPEPRPLNPVESAGKR